MATAIRIALSLSSATNVIESAARNAAYFAGVDTSACEVRCVASGAINSAGEDYTTSIPAEEFCRIYKTREGVKVELQPVELITGPERDIYSEQASVPGTDEQQAAWLASLQADLNEKASLSLVAGWAKLTAEELTTFVDVSYKIHSNPLPALRALYRPGEPACGSLVKAIEYSRLSGVTITI